jgi:hypothetical protein
MPGIGIDETSERRLIHVNVRSKITYVLKYNDGQILFTLLFVALLISL